MDIYEYLLIVFAGIFAGFINTLAGSGSLITLPLLIFFGLTPTVANGTNRIAIFVQSLVASSSMKKQKIYRLNDGVILGIPTVVGSITGAILANISGDLFMEKFIAGLLVVMFFLILIKPEIWIKGRAGEISSKSKIINIIIFFFIGVYGGFIQAGVGLFLLAGLVLGYGSDLIKANGLKNFIVLLYTPFALMPFIIEGNMNYVVGIVLALGNMAGAYLAARFGVKWGAKFVRYLLLFVIIAASLKLLGVFDNIFTAT